MDNMSDLAFFSQLAKAASMASAAQLMGVTPSTVTKRLAQLERRLCVRLMHRTTRRMSLTQEGELFLSEGGRILDELRLLEDTLGGAQASPRGLLRVHATLGFGRRHIGPAVLDFANRYPEVSVQLQLGDRPVNLVGEGFDVAIHVGELPDARLTARRIVRNTRVLCASPDYLARAGSPARPAELHSHQCIVLRQSDETFGVWHLNAGARNESVKVDGDLTTNDGEVALDWALRGQGILMRSTWNTAQYLRSGQLHRVLADWSLPPADIMAVYPTKQHLSAKTRAFVDHMVQAFEEKVF